MLNIPQSAGSFKYFLWNVYEGKRYYDYFRIDKSVVCNVSEAELARRLGKSPQSFNSKKKRGNFPIPEIEQVADVLGVFFNRKFILENGNKI